MALYKKYFGKPGEWTEWVRPIRRGYKMACCDCGLVHSMDFRIRNEWRGNVVEFRVMRNQKATSAMRRYMRGKHGN